jgi:RND family efflux transporter MFP subunit
MRRNKAIFLLITLLIVAGLVFWVWQNWKAVAAKQQAAMAQMAGSGQAMPVQAARCVRQDVTDFYEFTGTTQSVDSAEVRARIIGYLQEIHFTDGSLVEKGQLLFTIEPAPYVAHRNEAMARLKAAEAEHERTRLDYERMQEAIKINAVSQQDMSRAEAAYRTADASMAEAKSALERAELELSYTEIRSPIRGLAGRHLVDAGNLVGASERTLLTTVVQVDPIYVFFYAGEQMLQKPFLQGLLSGQGGSSPFMAGLSTDTDYPYEGQIRYIDNTVDSMTGTVFIRGEVPNEKGKLLPGMFMRVRVPGDVRPKAVLIQEKAIITDLNGKYVLVVGDNAILQRRNVQLGMSVGSLKVITEGLTGDEVYVLNNLHMVRPGMPVVPMFGEIPTGAPAAGPSPAGGKAPSESKPAQQN